MPFWKNPSAGPLIICKNGHFKRSDLDFDLIDPEAEKMTQKKIKINDIEVDYIVINRDIVNDKFTNKDRLFIEGVSNWVRLYGDDTYDDLIRKANEYSFHPDRRHDR
jgi:hypothetical protein